MSAVVSDRYGLPSDCLVVGGTTDSIAAFLAAGFSVADPGEVTKANVGVADVHHHQNIFNGEILKPLLPALERICPE